MIPSDLIVRPGMEITAERWNKLVRWVETGTPNRATGARRRFLPSGVITSVEGGGRTAPVDHKFKLSITQAEEKTEIRFSLGLIGGREPLIGETPISKIDESTGLTPALIVKADQFAPIGGGRFQSLLYFRVDLNSNWEIERIEAEALKAPPEKKAWTAWKLVAFLLRDGEDGPVSAKQMLCFNQAFAPTARRGNGFFKPWFSAQ